MNLLRYAIGCSIFDKKTRTNITGVYAESSFGAYVCSGDTENTSKSFIRVFNNPEHALKFAQKLSKSYDFEFNQRAKSCRVNRDKFRFFLMKVDSSKFPLVLTKRRSSNGAEHIKWETYDFVKK